MASIVAVCLSKEKGAKKEAVSIGILRENYGLVGDAHAEAGIPRQISLLAIESINKMRSLGLEVGPGDFAENLTIEGMDLASLPVGTRLGIGSGIVLEISQIGKECHNGCAIYRQAGTCVMPAEGVFARVIRGAWSDPGTRYR